jgi:hypothetical protein
MFGRTQRFALHHRPHWQDAGAATATNTIATDQSPVPVLYVPTAQAKQYRAPAVDKIMELKNALRQCGL